MRNRFKTIAILALLFILLAIFWGIVGNYLLPKKSISQDKDTAGNLQDVIPILYVNDMNESLNLYEDILGFDKIDSTNDNNPVYLKCGSVIIGLSQKDETTIHDSMGQTKLIFVVDNLDQVYKSIHDKYKTINPIKERLDKKKSFALLDYDKNILVFQEEKETD